MWLVPVGTLLQFEHLPSVRRSAASRVVHCVIGWPAPRGVGEGYVSAIHERDRGARDIWLVPKAVLYCSSHYRIAQSPTSGSLSAMRIHKVWYNSSLPVKLIPCDGAATSGEQLRELQRLLIRLMKVYERCDGSGAAMT